MPAKKPLLLLKTMMLLNLFLHDKFLDYQFQFKVSRMNFIQQESDLFQKSDQNVDILKHPLFNIIIIPIALVLVCLIIGVSCCVIR